MSTRTETHRGLTITRVLPSARRRAPIVETSIIGLLEFRPCGELVSSCAPWRALDHDDMRALAYYHAMGGPNPETYTDHDGCPVLTPPPGARHGDRWWDTWRHGRMIARGMRLRALVATR